MERMKYYANFVFVLVSLFLDMNSGLQEGNTLVANHLDELLSLSELPLKKLLHVKRTFIDPSADEFSDDLDTHDDSSDSSITEQNINPLGTAEDTTPEALALVGAGNGHTKRMNPLLNNNGGRFKVPFRRGGGSGHGGSGHGGSGHGSESKGKGKGKKASISSIFQTSVTALAFLAFGGYLLCLICQAVRQNNGGMTMAMMNGASTQGNMSRLVFIGRRPMFGKRRKRSSTENKTADEKQLTGIVDHHDDRNVARNSPKTNEINLGEILEAEVAEKNERDEESVLTSEYGGFYEPRHANVSDEEIEISQWPQADVDAMYRALIMISEGYSLYHEALHTR